MPMVVVAQAIGNPEGYGWFYRIIVVNHRELQLTMMVKELLYVWLHNKMAGLLMVTNGFNQHNCKQGVL